MSDLGFNKIAFCVLGTGLALIGLNEAAHAMFHTTHHEKMGWEVAVSEVTTGETVVEGPRDYFTLISTADIAKGEEQHKKCLQCHTFVAGGANLQGPNLYAVLGRDVAAQAGFKYSSGKGSLSEVEGVWDYQKLDHFIERPKAFASGTAMNFAGINSRLTGLQDRMNLIAYLRTLGSESVPLPDPLPVQPAAPADAAAAPVEGAAPAAPVDGATAPATPPTVPGAAPAPAPAQPAPAAPH